jgi:hypothetical protein
MASKIRRKGYISFLFLKKNVMNNSKSFFIGIDIIECENSIDLLTPLMIGMRKGVPS